MRHFSGLKYINETSTFLILTNHVLVNIFPMSRTNVILMSRLFHGQKQCFLLNTLEIQIYATHDMDEMEFFALIKFEPYLRTILSGDLKF